MELTYQEDFDLRTRGRAWLGVLGISGDDAEDILQRAMLRVYQGYESRRNHDDTLLNYARTNWKKMLGRALSNFVRDSGRYRAMLARYADSLEVYTNREEFIIRAREMISDSLGLLTDKQILTLTLLANNDFDITDTAKEMEVSARAVYGTLNRVQERMDMHFDLTRNPGSKGTPAINHYREKEGSWGVNEDYVVVCDIEDTHGLYDPREAEPQPLTINWSRDDI